MSLPDGKMRHLQSVYAEGGGVKYLDDGSILLSVIESSDKWSYRIISPDGKVKLLGKPARLHDYIDVSGDLQQAVVATSKYQGDVWIMKTTRR